MTNLKITLAAGKRKIIIKKQVLVTMKCLRKQYQLVFIVITDLFCSMVLGVDWLKKNAIIIDCERNIIYEREEERTCEHIIKEEDNTETQMMGLEGLSDIEGRGSGKNSMETEVLSRLEGRDQVEEEGEVLGNLTKVEEEALSVKYYVETEDSERNNLKDQRIATLKRRDSKLLGARLMEFKTGNRSENLEEKAIEHGENVWTSRKEKWKNKFMSRHNVK